MPGLGLGITARRGGLSPAIAASLPSLDLDFLKQGYQMSLIGKAFSEIFAFSRASGGGRINASGVYEWLAVNQPRFDYEPDDIPILGSELFPQPSLSSSAGIRVDSGWNVSGGVATATATNALLGDLAASSSNYTPGKAYRVGVLVGTRTAGQIQAYLRGVLVTGFSSVSATGWTYGTVIAGSSAVEGLAIVGINSFSGTISGISVRELIGYSARKGDPKGILIEEQRTNLLTYSDQADNAACTKSNTSVSANAVVSPDGSVSADKLIEDSTANWHYGSWSFPATAGSAYTISCFFKSAERSSVFLGANNVSGTLQGTAFNLSGAGSASYWGVFSAPTTSGIQNVGNGWYRAWITVVAAATATMNVRAGLFNGAISYTGDGSSGAYVWGWQAEAGAFPTSYIPTSGSQATRAADSLSINTLSPWFKSSEGSIFVDGDTPAVGSARFLSFSNGSTNELLVIDKSPGTVVLSNRTNAISGPNATGATNAWQTGAIGKAAAAYSASGNAISANGTAVGTSAANAIAAGINKLEIGAQLGNSMLNGHIRKLRYWPKRLSDAQLQALTA